MAESNNVFCFDGLHEIVRIAAQSTTSEVLAMWEESIWSIEASKLKITDDGVP